MAYIGSRMSVRAQSAHDDGLHPLSYWTKRNIIDALYDCYSDDVVESLIRFSKKTLQDFFLSNNEWHHTGKCYNCTDFYGIKNDDEIDFEHLEFLEKENHTQKKIKKLSAQKVLFRYGTWEGTREHPKLIEREAYGLLIGNWIYFEEGKKNVTGKHVDVLQKYNRAPNGTSVLFKAIAKNLPKSIKTKLTDC